MALARFATSLAIETALVLCLWSILAALNARFFLLAYLPGYLAGLALCALQGYWEHAAGRPTSHYGRVYNFLCFNDGYHAETPADPAIHWTALPIISKRALPTAPGRLSCAGSTYVRSKFSNDWCCTPPASSASS